MNKWQKYESEKALIEATAKTSEEYESRIRELLKRLKL